MRATVLHAPGLVSIDDVPDPRIEEPTDAIVTVELAAICGSDLGGYSGVEKVVPGQRMGHEFLGIVTEVGSATEAFRKGDRVIAPLSWSCGRCRPCTMGLATSCVRGAHWGTPGTDGGQAEAVRVPFADSTLHRLPSQIDPHVLPTVLTVSDVLSAGWHAASVAKIKPSDTVAVVGDGSVGACAVLAAKSRGAERIILLGRYPQRIYVARQFGATDVITSRDTAAIVKVRELTDGHGADVVIDSFGSEQSMATSIGAVRDGGTVCLVGVTHEPTNLDINTMIMRNITLHAGVVPAARYMGTLLPEVLAGRLDVSALFDLRLPLGDVPSGYAAMAERSAIKALIEP